MSKNITSIQIHKLMIFINNMYFSLEDNVENLQSEALKKASAALSLVQDQTIYG